MACFGHPIADQEVDPISGRQSGGNAFYVDGDVAEQPDRMDLLVELLSANVHPKLSPDVAKASIATISAESSLLRAAVEDARPARAKLQLYERVLTAITRSAAIELAQLNEIEETSGLARVLLLSPCRRTSRRRAG